MASARWPWAAGEVGWGRRGRSGGVPGKRFHVELPTAADGGRRMANDRSAAARCVALRCVGWSILLLGLAETNNTKTQTVDYSTGRRSRQRQPTDVRGGEHWSERV